jgi:ATP-dependent 26S proteasome regulatory subunit
MSNNHVTNKYRTDLVEAINELQRLEAASFEMETQIAKQKKKVAALHELAEMDDEGPAPIGLVQGITDACRTVFRAAEKPLYPVEVKSRVEALGLPPQQNLLASVHTVIRRLLAANEVEEVNPEGGSGPVAYRSKSWISRVKIDKALLAAALGPKEK